MNKLPAMPNLVKRKLGVTSKLAWDSAIKEARRQLVITKRRVEGLERTVQNWTRLRDEGMPWPGDSGQDSK